MATSNAMNTSNQRIKYTISVTLNSQSVADNTSNVTVQVRFYRTNTGYTSYGNGTVYCIIDGTKYSASVTSDDKITNSGIVLFSKTLNISHGSDGKKTLSCSAWIDHDVVTSDEQSYSQALPAIYRASVPTVCRLDGGLLSEATMGDTVYIYTNAKSSSFTHTIKYDFGPIRGATIKTSAGASFAWQVPDVAQYCPDALGAECTITCITYNGSTKVGEETCKVTLNVPRESIPTASNVTMGNQVTVNTNAKSSNFTHNIELWFAGEKVSTTTAKGSVSMDVPLTLAKKIPSATEGTATIKCTTYNGTAVVGTVKTCSFTATVPQNDTTKPTASWTITPQVGYIPAGMEGLFIQGVTGVKADFAASSTYSTIASYTMAVDGKTYSGDPATSQRLTKSGNVVVNGTVTDARGYPRALQETISVLPYSAPGIESTDAYNRIVCERSDQDKTYKDDGTFLHINCKVKHTPITVGGVDKNATSLSYAVKGEGGTYGAETKLFDTSQQASIDIAIPEEVENTTISYTVKLIVEDAIGSSEVYYFTIPTADIALHLAEGGHGVAVGKYATIDKAFEIADDWDLVSHGKAHFEKGIYANHIAMIGLYHSKDFDELIHQSGYYPGDYKPSSVSCSNYPVDSTGVLEVISHTSDTSTFAYQTYRTHDGEVWIRSLFSERGWTPWAKITTT